LVKKQRFKYPKTKAYYLFRVFSARDTADLARSIEPQQQQRCCYRRSVSIYRPTTTTLLQQRRPSGGVERVRPQVEIDSFNPQW
jgi:hypothetical protein